MSRVYVGKLDSATSEEDLKSLFKQFGTIIGAYIIPQNKPVFPLVYGFVHFEKEEDAHQAVIKMNGFTFRGQQLRVEQAVPDRNPKRNHMDPPSDNSDYSQVKKKNYLHSESLDDGRGENLSKFKKIYAEVVQNLASKDQTSSDEEEIRLPELSELLQMIEQIPIQPVPAYTEPMGKLCLDLDELDALYNDYLAEKNS